MTQGRGPITFLILKLLSDCTSYMLLSISITNPHIGRIPAAYAGPLSPVLIEVPIPAIRCWCLAGCVGWVFLFGFRVLIQKVLKDLSYCANAGCV